MITSTACTIPLPWPRLTLLILFAMIAGLMSHKNVRAGSQPSIQQTSPNTETVSLTPLSAITQIAVGGHHVCALTQEGGVFCWGDNERNHLGDGSGVDQPTPVAVTGLSSGVTAIAAGEYHTCVLLVNASVQCWGYNGNGQLGNGNKTTSRSPVAVIGLNQGVLAITAGVYHSCALLVDQTVQCWGYNRYGQLGNDSTTDSDTPVKVLDLKAGAKAITAGNIHTCALLITGRVQCWGINLYGQVGDGTGIDRWRAVDIVGNYDDFTAVAAGGNHTCAVTTTQRVRCWGQNSFGQFGNGQSANSNKPLDSGGMNQISALTAGQNHTCALLQGGGVQCWGGNDLGQVGDGAQMQRLVPVAVNGLAQGVRAVDAGIYYTCALLQSGTVRCWGWNDSGQLGYGQMGYRTIPTPVLGLEAKITALAAGSYFSCFLSLDAGIKCAGRNELGQLGNGRNEHSYKLVDVAPIDDPVTKVVAGGYHACSLAGGTVSCWGRNGQGQLGDGSLVNRNQPVKVVGLIGNVQTITSGTHHTCVVIVPGGAVQCWGWNDFGQLGDGSRSYRAAPVNVPNLNNVIELAAGYAHTCALFTTGGVKCWGWNEYGQLGNGTITISSTTPVDVFGLSSDVKAIAAGYVHTCALLTSGAVKCWGNNSLGELGNGSKILSPTPADVIALDGPATAIAIGSESRHSCALLATGGVKCWGHNRSGQVGDDTVVERYAPVSVRGLASGVTALAVGYEHSCALLNNRVQCWGRNDYGQLSDEHGWRTTPVDVMVSVVCHKLTLTHIGNGQAPVAAPLFSPGCPVGHYRVGEPVMLHAQPVSGWRIAQWRGTADDTHTSTNATLAMPARAHTVTATFSAIPPEPGQAMGDSYEQDDSCLNAQLITPNSIAQEHTFHRPGDLDWVRFDAKAGVRYRVEVTTPPTSTADVRVQALLNCRETFGQEANPGASPGVRFDLLTTTVASPIYLQLNHVVTLTAGVNVAYEVSVRALEPVTTSRALILVGGALAYPDSLQKQIDSVTQTVYHYYRSLGYSDADIYYLADTATLAGRDQPATLSYLEEAITAWAKARLSPGGELILYLVDHGEQDKFYLNGEQQTLTPAQLDGWLDQVEAAIPDLRVTVIIEACYAGSFISVAQAISTTQPLNGSQLISDTHSISLGEPGRIVITSTDDKNRAFASSNGAYFSDFFLSSLQLGYNLSNSFRAARAVVDELSFNLTDQQRAWIDANGNGIPNEEADGILARSRQSETDTPAAIIASPPYIITATVASVGIAHSLMITATVKDDQQVKDVWAQIFSPSVQTTGDNAQLALTTAPKIELIRQPTSAAGQEDTGLYTATYPDLQEAGLYAIRIEAKDSEERPAPPKVLTISVGSRIFLPIVTR